MLLVDPSAAPAPPIVKKQDPEIKIEEELPALEPTKDEVDTSVENTSSLEDVAKSDSSATEIKSDANSEEHESMVAPPVQ